MRTIQSPGWQHCTVVHHPPFGQDDEAFDRCVGALDDRDGYSARLVGGPLRLVALIAAIDKGHCHPWALTMNRAEHGRECVSILDTCGCDLALDWQAECIHRDMSLAALDFLARVEAARPARFRRLDRLAVDDDRRRRGLAALIL